MSSRNTQQIKINLTGTTYVSLEKCVKGVGGMEMNYNHVLTVKETEEDIVKVQIVQSLLVLNVTALVM